MSTPRARLLPVVLALLALPLTACATSEAPAPATGEVVDAQGQTLDAASFATLAGQEDVVVLDVRTPAEFAEGHLPGAVNLDVSDPAFTAALADLDADATYAVYCRSGNRSAQALELMRQAGITSTAHLEGGIGAWQGAGGEVVRGT